MFFLLSILCSPSNLNIPHNCYYNSGGISLKVQNFSLTLIELKCFLRISKGAIEIDARRGLGDLLARVASMYKHHARLLKKKPLAKSVFLFTFFSNAQPTRPRARTGLSEKPLGGLGGARSVREASRPSPNTLAPANDRHRVSLRGANYCDSWLQALSHRITRTFAASRGNDVRRVSSKLARLERTK